MALPYHLQRARELAHRVNREIALNQSQGEMCRKMG